MDFKIRQISNVKQCRGVYSCVLLGQTNDYKESNHDKDNLKARNTKKIKGGEQSFTLHSSLLKSYNDVW